MGNSSLRVAFKDLVIQTENTHYAQKVRKALQRDQWAPYNIQCSYLIGNLYIKNICFLNKTLQQLFQSFHLLKTTSIYSLALPIELMSAWSLHLYFLVQWCRKVLCGPPKEKPGHKRKIQIQNLLLTICPPTQSQNLPTIWSACKMFRGNSRSELVRMPNQCFV